MSLNMNRPSMDTGGSGTGLPSPSGNVSPTWELEEKYWYDNFSTRPYIIGSETTVFEYYRPAYRYGYESAQHHVGRSWDEAETDLRSGWDRYEHAGEQRSTWDEIKHAVKDAWDRVTGQQPTDTAHRDTNG